MGTKKDLYLAAEQFIREQSLSENTISREDLDFLLARYHVPLVHVAAMLNCPAATLVSKAKQWRLLREYPGLETQPAVRSLLRQNTLNNTHKTKYADVVTIARRFTEGLGTRRPTADELRYLYIDLSLPIAEIAPLFGKSLRTISSWMEDVGVARRTPGETKRAHYHANFFKTWSAPMAWILGLLYTDGNLYKERVALFSTDIELLEKVRPFVAPHLTISESRQSYNPQNWIGTLRISHRDMVSDLRRLGLSEKKSLTMDFPDMPNACLRHFIRGCWGGDGGFTGDNRKLTAHYTCGSWGFIKQLALRLFDAGIVRQNLQRNASESAVDVQDLRERYGSGPYPLSIRVRHDTKAFDLATAFPQALERLHDFFYLGVDSSMYLSRKFELLHSYVMHKRQSALD